MTKTNYLVQIFTDRLKGYYLAELLAREARASLAP